MSYAPLYTSEENINLKYKLQFLSIQKDKHKKVPFGKNTEKQELLTHFG